MNRFNTKRRAQIISCLVQGNSIRDTSRMTGASKNTVTKLLVDSGVACAEYQNLILRGLPCKRIQCNEIWAFRYAKAKNDPEDKRYELGYGDVWTWTAICADTKLVPVWLVGNRDANTASIFIKDLASRLAQRVQITTGGHKAYWEASEIGSTGDADSGMLANLYGLDPATDKRYSLAKCIGAYKNIISGNLDSNNISTSDVERQNLPMRMSVRRFTRFTNAFPNKVENLAHAVSLHFMYYNFARVHQSLKVTPAIEASVSDHVWSLEEIAARSE